VLSTLRLDFWLSACTGFIAGAEYILISSFLLANPEAGRVAQAMAVPIGYLTKGILLGASGVLAGLVGMQIRLRVMTSFRTVNERDKAISLFGQQVSQAVADELLNQQHLSKKQRVCVMFLDIRNFTPLVERKNPEEVVAYLNTLFGIMIEIVTRKHGIINQFLGDGFMATFGAPLSSGQDSANAVDAAMEIVERVETAVGAGELPPTRLGIGLHAGEAVTGNIGSAIRKQYSITGNVVITASRIEQLNKEYGSQVLVSQEVWEAAGRNSRGVSLGHVLVKGREEPITLFKLA
jgi:adenylate cyclase